MNERSRKNWIRLIIILPVMAFLAPVSGFGNIYVSKDGSNINPGTISAPVETVEHALGLAGPGDTLFISEGVYHEQIVLSNIDGTTEAPIVVTARKGNSVILDGTVPVESTWTRHEGNIYKTSLEQEIWQLFVGDRMMMPARWPNAFLHDGSVWDRERNWGHGDAALAENGIFVDAPHGNASLAASGLDATGSIAIMNIGSWKTWSRDVLSHSMGSNTFTYDLVPAYKDKHHYYYLEGKLELLDAAGEWFYDRNTKELFVWMPDSTVPSADIRGKVQSYFFNLENSSYIEFTGLEFFATTFYFKNCTHMTVEDCELKFPSCSKRTLGDHSEPEVTTMFNANTSSPTNNALINCSITNTESQAISFKGHSNRIENCSFYAIDWVVANRPGLMNSIYNEGNFNIFRRNSVELSGASSTLYPGNFPVVELNRITATGFLQSDGSITQLTIGAQPGSQTRFNWFHHTVKSGARFDAPMPPTVWGHGGTMRHNVVWETNIGLMQKGEYHFCFHNSVFNCEQNGIVILDDASDGGGGNKGTITRNNFSDKLSGHRSEYVKVPGTADHNWNGYGMETDFRDQVYDYSNHDFRPRWNSALVDTGIPIDGLNEPYMGIAPDLGAYEFGDSVYWIAGRQLEGASNPIPLDQKTSRYEFVDLMWLEGYRAQSSDIYFGTSETAVGEADRGSPVYKGNQTNNIFYPGALQANQTYFWRIDAVIKGANVKGEVWSFAAGINANPPVHMATFRVFGLKDGEVTPLDGAIIQMGERKSVTGADGSAIITMLPEGMYGYHVSQHGYSGIADSIYISSDRVLYDTLEHTTYNITFVLTDADRGEAIEGGTIHFGGLELITGIGGKAVLSDVEYSWYEVSAWAWGFDSLENHLVEIYSDTILELTLLREYLRVSVRVVNRVTGNPVYRARISYGDQLKLTNDSGDAVLDRIMVGSWVYTIEHNEYFTLTDSVMIRNDTLLEIGMISKLAYIRFEVADATGPVAGALVELDETLSLVSGADGVVKFISLLAREKHRYSIAKEGYRTISDSLFLEIDTVVAILLQWPAGITDPAVPDLDIYPNPVKEEMFFFRCK